ncbi:ABC transporter permease, partial [Rhizobium johnstonii]
HRAGKRHGGGNRQIDVAGTVALKLMNVENGMILPGLIVAIVIGLVVGLGNYALIKALRITPIIATLSMSFIVQSAAIWTNR